MRIQSVSLTKFKRFADLAIENLPATARLVVLVGPNGSGKTSLFEAFNLWRRTRGGMNLKGQGESTYYGRGDAGSEPMHRIQQERIVVNFHGQSPADQSGARRAFSMRTAYRNEADFRTHGLEAVDELGDEHSFHRLSENDAVVSRHYRRLVSASIHKLYVDRLEPGLTVQEFRDRQLLKLNTVLQRLFGNGLHVAGLGDPLKDGTFVFHKDGNPEFRYQNLSAGEKAAFDLICDMALKSVVLQDAVYCIDEPDLHLNTALQAELLQELVALTPERSQLWVATHSIGMLRRARDLLLQRPTEVVFLDFSGRDFNLPQTLAPVPPSHDFWRVQLKVALDDLAGLIAPEHVVVCEGSPKSGEGGPDTNHEHDARCLANIFRNEFLSTEFVSGESSSAVQNMAPRVAYLVGKLSPATKLTHLIDRDDLTPEEVADKRRGRIRVLQRREIENYLWDDEVLTALCVAEQHPEQALALIAARDAALERSVRDRGNPVDDMKSAAGDTYFAARKLLGLTSSGSSARAFERDVLSKLFCPSMKVYAELREAVFGD